MLRLSRLIDDLAVAPPNAGDLEIDALSADSRAIKPGTLFAALPGSRQDGRRFIEDAIGRGAVAVLASPGTEASVPVIASDEPRQTLALLAARFYGEQPSTVVAVTGTNGKTSVASFARQIWIDAGHKAASLGTLGLIATGFPNEPSLTTPDPITLHQTLARLKQAHIDRLAIEASSHGLEQYRLDGVQLAAGGFTNLTRDHLDYHGTMEAYFAAKSQLFSRVLPAGAVAVLNLASPYAGELYAIAIQRRLGIITYGSPDADISVIDGHADEGGHDLQISVFGRRHDVRLNLAGDFQVDNALCALGLVLGSGADEGRSVGALAELQGAPGRMQRVATSGAGAPVFVDYAHTPDALETVLRAFRRHTTGKLVVVFGCGGDRDPGKRPLMGEIATRLADLAILTDDNPRSEQPAQIRKDVLAGCVGRHVVEIGDRAAAIDAAVAGLASGDLLVIAGKGHEQGQIVGSAVLPFDDAEVARLAVAKSDGVA